MNVSTFDGRERRHVLPVKVASQNASSFCGQAAFRNLFKIASARSRDITVACVIETWTLFPSYAVYPRSFGAHLSKLPEVSGQSKLELFPKWCLERGPWSHFELGLA